MIGVLSNAVEIRSIEPRLMIQKIEMEKLKLNLVSVCCRGVVFVASTNNVWCLQGVDLLQQINHLLNDKHFELALKLCVSVQSCIHSRLILFSFRVYLNLTQQKDLDKSITLKIFWPSTFSVNVNLRNHSTCFLT